MLSLTKCLVLLAASPVAILAQMTTKECSDVHVFLVKGWSETYPGRQGVLVTAICNGLENCDYEDVVWTNTERTDYCKAIYQGATNGLNQLQAYNARCPNTQLVISGFSQGAHVVGDFLGGGGGRFFGGCKEDVTPYLDATSPAGKMIKVILTWGDVRHTKNQPYNFQSGAGGQGMFPRTDAELVNLNLYASVWRDYCVATDPVCARGTDVATHDTYFDIFADTAAEWVQKQVIKLGAKAKTRSLAEDESPVVVKKEVYTSPEPDFMSIMRQFMHPVEPSSSTSPSPSLEILPGVTAIPTLNLSAMPFISGPRHTMSHISDHEPPHTPSSHWSHASVTSQDASHTSSPKPVHTFSHESSHTYNNHPSHTFSHNSSYTPSPKSIQPFDFKSLHISRTQSSHMASSSPLRSEATTMRHLVRSGAAALPVVVVVAALAVSLL